MSQVAVGSQAQEMGVIAGDIITSLDGQEIRDSLLLDECVDNLEPGQTVDLTLYRSGSEVAITLIWGNSD